MVSKPAKLRTLYWSRVGSRLAARWDDMPVWPKDKSGQPVARPTKFRAPDIWHEGIHPMEKDEGIVRVLQSARILPASGFHILPIRAEWADLGLSKAKASVKKKSRIKTDPEVGGLFAASDVARTYR